MLQNNPSITLVSNECHTPFLFYGYSNKTEYQTNSMARRRQELLLKMILFKSKKESILRLTGCTA